MSDLCPLCGASPTAVEALRARVAEVERERDARPDPGALLARFDTIRAASATGATPAQLARMVEDVQMSMIRPPTGDATLLTTQEPK